MHSTREKVSMTGVILFIGVVVVGAALAAWLLARRSKHLSTTSSVQLQPDARSEDIAGTTAFDETAVHGEAVTECDAVVVSQDQSEMAELAISEHTQPELGRESVPPVSTSKDVFPQESILVEAEKTAVDLEHPSQPSADLSTGGRSSDESDLDYSSPEMTKAIPVLAPPSIDQSLIIIAPAVGPDTSSRPFPEQPAEDSNFADELGIRKDRPAKPAQHQDRRGQRRSLPTKRNPTEHQSPKEPVSRIPAEARFRLLLHPIRRTATLSAVLARPSGYPNCVTLLTNGNQQVFAYDEERFDDVDLIWSSDLLSDEFRLNCKEGFQWLRSGRRIHIFSAVPNEPGLISVGSASLASTFAIICQEKDAEAVHLAAKACGSPTLVSHDNWMGVPRGSVLLSGYRPTHAAEEELESGMTGLNPGLESEILISGALKLSSRSFAEGTMPKIEIVPFPAGAKVTIDGKPASLGEDGSWRADGWDQPGDHLVDVVPGPSTTYRILEDPWLRAGWENWNAHTQRFPTLPNAPWARAMICGAGVFGSENEFVLVAEAPGSVVGIGLYRGMTVLQERKDAPIAVGLLREPPAFLISSTGPRRSQGRIAWLYPSTLSSAHGKIDLDWIRVVRGAAARRLSVEGDDPAGQEEWRKAKERARRHRRTSS